MKNLLSFEFRKLTKQKSFYVCTILLLVFSIISMLLSKAVANADTEVVVNLSAKSALLTAFSASNFTMISGIFLALFVCDDYSNGTIKNVYARGFSKTKVYFSKLIVGLSAIIFMFLITLVFSFGAGSAMFNGTAEAGNYIGLLVGQLVLALAYGTFVFAISIIMKKVGSSIALAILGPSLITTVLSLADAVLKIKDFSLSNYWLDGFANNLTKITTTSSNIVLSIALSVVYIAVFVMVGWCIQRKQEN